MKKGNIFAFSLIVSIILITLAPRFGFIWKTSETDPLRSTPENIRHILFCRNLAARRLFSGYVPHQGRRSCYDPVRPPLLQRFDGGIRRRTVLSFLCVHGPGYQKIRRRRLL